MDLKDSVTIATSGLAAQGKRLRVTAENLANANTTARAPGGDPFKRKTITFRSELDRATGVQKVKVDRIKPDTKSEFGRKYDPSHPAADAQGYVKTPNVNALSEAMDMREAQTSYEANLQVVRASRGMMSSTVDLLRD
ncbi:MAG: flagellar basal body rod protein FlgC [Alphaproteobacteria bacterium]|nr:flagellar basal body rod protein FlgC [Alphaproteobacteria bacterium]